ncbi:MAG: DUF6377 domain-containing protein [Prevotellaceae bacterium]|jgi:DNA-binding CsgD family transcriptional regulator|nr:DUF6377 domain-containing protein [Prevotellaceae bacterium]
MKKIIFFLIILSAVFCEISAKNNLDSILNILDFSITQTEKYDRAKEQTIDSLKTALRLHKADGQTHQLYFQIFKEYETFVFDSAFFYANEHLIFSQKENNKTWIAECKIELSRMYAVFAQFSEALSLLKSIDKKQMENPQLSDYYNAFAEIYFYWGEYSNIENKDYYVKTCDLYQDSALALMPKQTYLYEHNYGRECIERGKFDEAKNALFPYLKTMQPNSRDYSILNSLVASYYSAKNDAANQKFYLAQSAIADIQLSIKENESLRLLAELLLNDVDIERSNRYVKKSLEDANFFNARLRNIQTAKILPVIDKAYQIEREEHQNKLKKALFTIGILLLFFVLLAVFLVIQMLRLAKARKAVISANKNLQEFNKKLSESNIVKEEYIGRFLNQCSVYIDKLESYRKMLNKKLVSGKTDELARLLKSPDFVDEELKEFYQNFDSTFINLFPDFVEKFNTLLPDEEKIMPKHEHSLSAELRIFALIRLGIIDSAKIANFLRYSITTIYNYRSKYRNKSLVPREKFEETVMTLN